MLFLNRILSKLCQFISWLCKLKQHFRENIFTNNLSQALFSNTDRSILTNWKYIYFKKTTTEQSNLVFQDSIKTNLLPVSKKYEAIINNLRKKNTENKEIWIFKESLRNNLRYVFLKLEWISEITYDKVPELVKKWCHWSSEFA